MNNFESCLNFYLKILKGPFTLNEDIPEVPSLNNAESWQIDLIQRSQLITLSDDDSAYPNKSTGSNTGNKSFKKKLSNFVS